MPSARHHQGPPELAGRTAFIGASWPPTSRTRSRPGTPDGSHGGAGWLRPRSAPSSRTGASNPTSRTAMAEGPLARFFWRVVDALDYLLTLVRLRILDELAGAEPE